MAYSDFTTIAKVKALGLSVLETQFLPKIEPIAPSDYGCVATGTGWKFLKLEGTIANIDVTLKDNPKPKKPIPKQRLNLKYLIQDSIFQPTPFNCFSNHFAFDRSGIIGQRINLDLRPHSSIFRPSKSR